MDNRQHLLLVFIALLTCDQGLTALNLTFFHEEMSWKKAADFCSKHNGVLESNALLVMKKIETIDVKDVWFGKYEVYSQWAYIRGCFLINGNLTNFTIKHSDEFQCQNLCDNYTFYTVQETQCYCTDDISTFERKTDCDCSGCYRVWEHKLTTYHYEHTDEEHECITATCRRNQTRRSYRSCEHNFFVTCDNNRNLKYSYNNHTTASTECYRNGSFIKWYQDDFCNLNNASNPFWTSGRRLKHIFHLNKSDDIHNGELHRCFKLQRDDDDKRKSEEDEEDCNKMYPFVCSFGLTEDDDDTAFNSTTSIPPEKNVQSEITASIAAGVIVSIIAVIAVILVLLFIHRQRLTKKKPTIHESQNSSHVQDTIGFHSNHKTSHAPVYNEIDGEDLSRNNRKFKYPQTVNNITYNQANSNIIPKPQNVYHSVNITSEANSESNELNSKSGKNKYGMVKVQNVTGNSADVDNSSNYCLAKPISSNTEEESDSYDINRDYDHLHNVKKKEDMKTTVYDHLPTAVTEDPTYDHSNFKSASDNEGYYDHFKIDGVND
ncbi:unnamed protein product [Mytilus coruscus]|uniref:C-type lectin domain-containing protein n=1 Tax=Mytilus coruscus TaxID=42192 RepID=A0A6J8EV41_MYTCO|nr:unnamed protein product [Mytilus coruscus]